MVAHRAGHWAAAAVAALVLVAAGTTARAQDEPRRDVATGDPSTGPAGGRGAIWLDLPFFLGGDDNLDVTGISPMLGARYGVIPELELEGMLGLAYAHETRTVGGFDRSDHQVSATNLYFGAYYVGRSDRLVFRIGGGLALPVSSQDDVVALAYGWAMRGLWDVWLWLPKYVGIVIPSGRLTYFASPKLTLMAESAFAILVDTSDADRETEIVWQLAGEVAYRAAEIISVGGRLQGVVGLTFDGDDDFQLMLEPFVRFHFPPGFFDVRLTMNLDHPAGFAFDQDRVWALHFVIGANFY